MRTCAAIITMLASTGAFAVAPLVKPRVAVIRTAPRGQPVGAIVIPAGSPLQLVSPLSPNGDVAAAFSGRFTLSGAYKVEGYGEDAFLTMWPDSRSRNALPHWQGREVPEEMDISNAWAFERAVLSTDQLQRMKSGKMKSARGQATIIADRYETSIDCDVVAASARFVSVVKKVRIVALPEEAEAC